MIVTKETFRSKFITILLNNLKLLEILNSMCLTDRYLIEAE